VTGYHRQRYFLAQFREQIKLLQISLNANSKIIQDKLDKLETHKEILKHSGGREQMERILGFKLKLKGDKDVDLLMDWLREDE
jgi:hypothetical protein